jgi:hypothetical protein
MGDEKNWNRENEAFLLLAKAALVLAPRNPDDSINNEHINAMFQKLLDAAKVLLNGPLAPPPKPKPVLRLVPKIVQPVIDPPKLP